uniref:Uncharacterized protein n=1 Tax=Arundo donax TaxID=35708 RepID=A0A0A9E6P6_ARUDO
MGPAAAGAGCSTRSSRGSWRSPCLLSPWSSRHTGTGGTCRGRIYRCQACMCRRWWRFRGGRTRRTSPGCHSEQTTSGG